VYTPAARRAAPKIAAIPFNKISTPPTGIAQIGLIFGSLKFTEDPFFDFGRKITSLNTVLSI